MLIDTHAHLYWDSFKKDFNAVIQRAVDVGIATIINIGVDLKTSKKALGQAQNIKWPAGLSVYSTIGIHPHEASKYDSDNSLQNDIAKLEEIYSSDPEKVAAVGECGLDFSSTSEESKPTSEVFISNQKKLFRAQIDLAKKLNLPLIVHCREAWDETLKMLGDQPAVLHCYSGLPPTTNYILPATNLIVSFAANLTYPKNEYLREAVKILPLEKILLETDSPFLAPQSKRGQRNEPSAVSEIAQLIANLKGMSLDEVAVQTTKNAKKIFRIS